ncbi:LCP family protein [Amycolatopsis sp. GM8]|uniref:LCP family protein n=1 Tax=Amycolatopsis sp. GM8 TaxID=2896530 RepID=UPI001F341036|nr:LCP family protein [Amycolatopsis sp. GM8]
MDNPPRNPRGARGRPAPRQGRPTDARYAGPARRPGPPPARRERPGPPPGRRPAPPPRRRRYGAKIAVGVVSLLVISLTGYAWAAMQGLVSGLTTADVINADQPPDGARDILLVGMDSRTDAQGNPLPDKLLAQLRAGVSDGEENTDTLIMVHIPNDGSKAVAISLPRDSYVNIPGGYGKHKINSAYARAKADARKKLQDGGDTDAKDVEVKSAQAGAKTLIATVEQLTGSSIDNYASINLLGFSDITQAIGGVDVCLKDNVNDSYSGAKFTAGKHTISGVEALEFVRQRHGLPRGDLDRVVRQQVFLAGMAHKVLSAGTLADPGKLSNLTDAIKKSVVLNQGWDIIAFAQQLKGLTGGQLQFQTIPVINPDYDSPTDGKAVQVDPGQVKGFVQGLTVPPNAPAPAAPTVNPNAATTVDVHNGTSKSGLAATVSQALAGKGFTAGETANASARVSKTTIHYPSGGKDAAQSVADGLGSPATLQQDTAVQSGHVLVVVGTNYAGTAQAMEQAAAPPTSSAPPPVNADEQPITADGITCVN